MPQQDDIELIGQPSVAEVIKDLIQIVVVLVESPRA